MNTINTNTAVTTNPIPDVYTLPLARHLVTTAANAVRNYCSTLDGNKLPVYVEAEPRRSGSSRREYRLRTGNCDVVIESWNGRRWYWSIVLGNGRTLDSVLIQNGAQDDALSLEIALLGCEANGCERTLKAARQAVTNWAWTFARG